MENGVTAGWPQGATGWTQKKCASLRCPVLSTESKLMQLQEVPIGPRASSLVRSEAWHSRIYTPLFNSAMFSALFLYPRKPKLVGLVHQHEPLRAAPAVQSQLWCYVRDRALAFASRPRIREESRH